MYWLGIHARILQALFGKGSDRSSYDVPVFNLELQEGIVRLETGLGHPRLVKGIAVNKDHCITLAPLGIGHERSRIHCNKQIAIVTGGSNILASDVDLEARHSGDCALRGAYLGRIVGEGGKFIAVDG